jgi:putative NADH-flavin reductase
MGHDVIAFVRRPNKLPLSHERLRVVIGDARDRFSIERVVQHAEAVVNAIAVDTVEPERTHVDVIDNIINGMKKHRVTRYVSMCDTHIQYVAKNGSTVGGRLSTLLLTPSASRLARLSQLMVHSISASTLSWSLVRTHQLNDDAFSGQYVIDTHNRILNARVSRANAADFLLRIAVNGSHVHELPIISNS